LYGAALFWASRSASCARYAKVIEMKSEHEFKVVEMKCEHEFAPSASIRRSTHLQALDVDRKDRREECELEKVVDDEDDRAEADPFSHDLSNPVSERLHTQVDTF
jgi:hypothetical protein